MNSDLESKPLNAGRAILFERVNPDCCNILDILGKNANTTLQGQEKYSLTDDVIREVSSKLAVTSFAEVVSKLKPVITVTADTNLLQTECRVGGLTSEYKEQGKAAGKIIKEVILDENCPMLVCFLHLLNGCACRFDCEWAVAESLVDVSAEEIFFADRNEFVSQFSTDSMDIDILFSNMIAKYDGIFLANYCINENQKSMNGHLNYGNHIVNFSGNGDMQVTILGCKSNGVVELTEVKREKYLQYIKEALKKAEVENSELWELALCMPYMNEEKNILLEKYSSFWARLTDMVFEKAQPLIETLLGIYAFFEQNQALDGQPVSLLITNISVQEIFEANRYHLLEELFTTVNTKSDNSESISCAIVPSMEANVSKTLKSRRERFKGNVGLHKACNTEESVTRLCELLHQYIPAVFLSVKSFVKQNDSILSEEDLEQWYRDISSPCRSGDLSNTHPCAPNFLISQGRCEISVEASYVAAGIMTSYYSPVNNNAISYSRMEQEVCNESFELICMNNKLIKSVLKPDVLALEPRIADVIKKYRYGFIFVPYKNTSLVSFLKFQ